MRPSHAFPASCAVSRKAGCRTAAGSGVPDRTGWRRNRFQGYRHSGQDGSVCKGQISAFLGIKRFDKDARADFLKWLVQSTLPMAPSEASQDSAITEWFLSHRMIRPRENALASLVARAERQLERTLFARIAGVFPIPIARILTGCSRQRMAFRSLPKCLAILVRPASRTCSGQSNALKASVPWVWTVPWRSCKKCGAAALLLEQLLVLHVLRLSDEADTRIQPRPWCLDRTSDACDLHIEESDVARRGAPTCVLLEMLP